MRKIIKGLILRWLAYEPIRLSAAHYPADAKALLSVETVLRTGALPVGLKAPGWLGGGYDLCVACLDRSTPQVDRELIAEAERRAGKHVTHIRHYTLPLAEFLEIMGAAHGLDEQALKKMSPAALAAPLRRYLCIGHAPSGSSGAGDPDQRDTKRTPNTLASYNK